MKKTFLTQKMVDGVPFAGERIEAVTWMEAETIAAEKGIEVVGEFKGEFPADLSVGEMLRRLEEMGAPAEMQSDIIDIVRERKSQ
jgi:hypothetical protein